MKRNYIEITRLLFIIAISIVIIIFTTLVPDIHEIPSVITKEDIMNTTTTNELVCGNITNMKSLLHNQSIKQHFNTAKYPKKQSTPKPSPSPKASIPKSSTPKASITSMIPITKTIRISKFILQIISTILLIIAVFSFILKYNSEYRIMILIVTGIVCIIVALFLNVINDDIMCEIPLNNYDKQIKQGELNMNDIQKQTQHVKNMRIVSIICGICLIFSSINF